MRLPFALPAVALICGVGAGSIGPTAAAAPAATIMIGAAVFGAATRQNPGWIFPTSIASGFFAAGAALGAHAAAQSLAGVLRPYAASPPLEIEGRLVEDAAPAPYGASLVVESSAVWSQGSRRSVSGGLRLSVGGSLVERGRHAWRAGRLVRLTAAVRTPTGFRNPGSGDDAASLARRGIALVGSVKSAALVKVVAHGHAAAEAAAAVRAWIRDVVGRRVGPHSRQSAAIVTAILIGDRAGLDADVERRLQEGGTYHVIAISGGNVAVLASLALVLARLAGVSARAGAVLAIALLVAYGFVAGGGPSVARATLAAVLYLAARVLDHRAPAANTLAVAVAVALLRAPLDLYDPGLALSYGATLALILGADAGTRHVFRRWSNVPPVVRASAGLAVATICAEIAVLPLSALAFGRVTIAGLVLNFAAIPLMAVVQTAGLAVLALDGVLPPLAALCAYVAHASAALVVESTALLDVAPWLTWRVPAPAIFFLVIYYGACAAAIAFRPARRPAIAIAACTGFIIAAPPSPRGPQQAELVVTVLDVGQGESILLAMPDGRHVLVDAGGAPGSSFNVGGRVVAPALTTMGVRRLAALALTHPDPDHIGGAPAILREFRPIEVWEGVPVPPHPARGDLTIQAASRSLGWRRLQAGTRLTFGPVEIVALHPPPPEWERQRARNDDSLVLDVRHGAVSILLTGDVSRDVERLILPSLRRAAIRILKAAHHGSATSTDASLLGAYRPHAVIFSAGRDNRFGHPAPDVLGRVIASGAEIFRTDEDGAIQIKTDGKVVRITTMTGGDLTCSAGLQACSGKRTQP
jgi:competence protein ComEC